MKNNPLFIIKNLISQILFRIENRFNVNRQGESQKQLEIVAQTIPYLLWTINTDGAVTYYNQRFKDYFSVTSNDTTKWNWDRVVHPGDIGKMLELRNKCLASGEVFEMEVRVKASDGTYRWFLVRSVPSRNQMAIIEKWIGTAVDIHDQKVSYIKMLELQQRTDAVVQHSHIIFWAVDKNGIFTYYEGHALRKVGITSKDRIGKSVYDLGNLTEPPLGPPVRRALLGETISQEICHDKKRWFHINFSPTFDEHGQISGVVGISTDITDRKNKDNVELDLRVQKQASSVVAKSEARLRAILNTTLDAIVTVDINGFILDWNPRAEAMFATTKDQASGTSLLQFFIGFENTEMAEFKSRSDRQHEIKVRNAKGKVIDAAVSVTALDIDGDAVYTAFISDITDRKNSEAKLLHQQAQLAEAQKISHIGSWEWDISLNQVSWSDELFKIHGLQPGEIDPQYKVTKKLIHPEDRELFDKKIEDCLIRKLPYTIEYRIIAKDGTQKMIYGNGKPVLDSQGKVLKLFGVCQDVTERKNSEIKLLNKRAQLAEAQKISHIGSWEWDAQTNLVSWSDELLKIHGYEQGQVEPDIDLGRVCIHHEDRAAFDRAIEKCMAEFSTYSIEYRIHRKDGAVRMIMASGKAVGDGHGKILRMLGVSQDITDQKKANDALKAIIDSSPLALIVSNVDGITERWNKAAEEIYGWTEAEAVGKLLPFINPENADGHQRLFKRIVRGEKILGQEVKRTRKDGSEIFLSLSAVPLLDSAKTTYGVLSIIEDITEDKARQLELIRARELAEQGTKAKSEFLAMMSHEIRTPINGVIGMTDLLLETSLNEEQQGYAETVQSSADALLSIINDILDFSKIEAGKFHLEILDFDLRNLIQDIERTLGHSASQKGVRLSAMIDINLKNSIFKSDPGRVRQVLNNLVSNAIKFTSEGSVTIAVKHLETVGSIDTIKVEVTDTGIGIPQTAIPKMFQAFSQADSTTTRRFGGTGLGLSISKQLVEMMGGEIGVDSAVGKGSTFWFKISLERGGAIEKANVRVVTPESIVMGRTRGRILLAEDNKVNQIVAAKILEKHGYSVKIASNGRECLEALRTEKFELILMDCHMPEMDGYEATEQIRLSAGKEFQDIPILAMTASAMATDREKCLGVGMNDYLTKPIKAQDLIDSIERHLAQYRVA